MVCLLAAAAVGSRPGSPLLAMLALMCAAMGKHVRMRQGPAFRCAWPREILCVLALGVPAGLGFGSILSLAVLCFNLPLFAFELGVVLPLSLAAYTSTTFVTVLAAAGWRASRPAEVPGGWIEAEELLELVPSEHLLIVPRAMDSDAGASSQESL